MTNLTKNKTINTNFIYLFALFLYSFFINIYYANLGSFPIDTFLHYDSSSRILKGDTPIKDYWIISGLIVDLIQSFFFKIFGINWYAYTIHSSLFNAATTIIVYFFFLNLQLKQFKAVIFSICFSTLSYTVSGTPFVDMHATLFLLISTLFIIQNLKANKYHIWSMAIFLMFMSFFSKQVPAAYAAVAYSIILGIYFFYKKKYKEIIINLSIIFIILILIYFLIIFFKLDFKNFYIQLIDYPRSIGSNRLMNFDITLISFFNKFKFLVIPLCILLFLKIKKNNSLETKIGSLIFVIFTIIIIFHQLMTKNQVYIYFLIPIILGFLELEIQSSKIKYKKYFTFLLIVLLAFVTIKYHLRFNENRKFHELTKTQLEQSIKAEKIHKSLKGLYWKNPYYDGSALDEIKILNKAIELINSSNSDEIMIITHYQFLDSITKKKLNYPNRTFTEDGVSMPLKNNKYFYFYKDFFKRKIHELNIKKIYFFKHENISNKVLTNYFNSDCLSSNENEIFYIFNIKC